MHYIFKNLEIEKYLDRINITSHFDIKINNNKKTVYISHGAGENIPTNIKKYNSDYYLCWNKAEYKYLTKLNKKVYLVGSIYNELTTPDKFIRDTYGYIPQHSFRKDIENKVGKLSDLVDIPDLLFPILDYRELELIALKAGYNKTVTSLVDDSNIKLFSGHRYLCSDRYSDNFNHTDKCKLLYSILGECLVEITSTFDLVGVNHGIKINHRKERERALTPELDEQEKFISKNYDDMCDMPMKDNHRLITDALEEIYSDNI